MKIVLATQISGTRDGLAWPPPGTEVDLSEQEAKDMIASGAAVDPDDEAGVHAARGIVPLTDEQIGGAPAARDITLGQPDTNLARARVVAEKGDEEARAAAERVGLDDYKNPVDDEPKVGDDVNTNSPVESAVVPDDEVRTASVDTEPKVNKRQRKSPVEDQSA